MEKIIWFIDENENQLRTYTRKLKRMMQPERIQINSIFPPYRTKEEYIVVLDDPNTGLLLERVGQF